MELALDPAINATAGHSPRLTSWLQPTWPPPKAVRRRQGTTQWGIYRNSVSLLIRTGIHQLFARYSEQFNSNYIAELLCAGLSNQLPSRQLELPWEDPPFEVPSLLIHATTTWRARSAPSKRGTRCNVCQPLSLLVLSERHRPCKEVITTLAMAKKAAANNPGTLMI